MATSKATSTALTATKIDRAKMSWTVGNPGNGTVVAYLSCDGGTTWDVATNNHMTKLTGTPSTSGFIFKFEFNTTGSPNIYVEDVIITNGREYNKATVTDMIVDAGLNLIRDLVNGDSTSEVTHIAVGTDGTAPIASNTTLGTENTRKTFETVSNDDEETSFEMWVASTEGNGVTLQEVGVFNAGAAGDMLGRSTFTGIAKDNTKELLIEYRVVYTDES